MSPSDVLAPEVLAEAGADLARRDPALPMLPLLLDDAVLSAWLSSRLGEPVVAHRRYLRYKAGTACLATVRLRSAQGVALLPERAAATEPSPDDRTVTVAHWAPQARAKLAKTFAKAVPGSVLVVDERAGVLVTTPAADRHLPALRRLQDPDRAADLVHRVTGDLPVGPTPLLTTMSYKPQRRWVGTVALPGGRRALLRAYRPDDVDHVVRTWAPTPALGDAGVPVARLLGSHARLGLGGVAWLEGRQLRLDDGGGLQDLGAVVAALHRSPGRLPGLAPTDREVGLRATAGLGATLRPDLAARLDRVTARAATALRGLAPQPVATLHGDLSHDQVVVRPDGSLGLIDLDRSRSGAAADDLGSVLATTALDGHDPGPLREQLLAGYARHADTPDRRALDVHLAVQLLARATDGFRSARPDWAERLGTAVALAEEAL